MSDTAVLVGRTPRVGYAYLPDWVLLSSISPGAKTLYWTLFRLASVTKHHDGLVAPNQDQLLEIAGVRSKTTLRKYLGELHKINAVESRTVRHPHQPVRFRTLYRVHETPSHGYRGLLNVRAFCTLKRHSDSR